jgi:hypothetical protein
MLDLELISDEAQLFFDQYVVSGSDDELFASGYLRGHVDLVLGGALINQQTLSLDDVISQVENSVNKAISSGELQQSDVVVVNQVLNSLIVKLSNHAVSQ